MCLFIILPNQYIQQAPERSTNSCLVHKSELTGSVCDRKRGASQSNTLCDMMFPATWYQRNINARHRTMGLDVSLQNPSGTDDQCIQQAMQMSVVSEFYSLCSSTPSPNCQQVFLLRLSQRSCLPHQPTHCSEVASRNKS
jgi:hypothetical protein